MGAGRPDFCGAGTLRLFIAKYRVGKKAPRTTKKRCGSNGGPQERKGRRPKVGRYARGEGKTFKHELNTGSIGGGKNSRRGKGTRRGSTTQNRGDMGETSAYSNGG